MDHIWENFAPWSWNTYSYNKDINYSFDRESIIGSINTSFFEQRSFYNCFLASNVKFHADAANSLWVHIPFGMTWWLQWGGPRARKKIIDVLIFFFFFWIWPIKHFYFLMIWLATMTIIATLYILPLQILQYSYN